MDINIIDGMDMTGKGAYINAMKEALTPEDNVGFYHADTEAYDGVFEDRNTLIMYAYGFLDVVSQAPKMLTQDPNALLVFDRALPSSVVYSQLYPTGVKITDEMVNSYLHKLYSSAKTVEFIYIKHSSYDSAKRIFLTDTNHNDKLDHFSDFDEYWRTYIKCDSLYQDFYDKWKLYPTVYESVSNDEGTRVKLNKLVD